MNLTRSVQLIFLFKCFLFFEVFCEKTRHSLIVTVKDGELELTKPIGYHEGYQRIEFKASEDGNTYHFCPLADSKRYIDVKNRSRMILAPSELIPPDAITNDENRCEYPNTPILLKVENPGEIKSNWNDDTIELYHFAFMLSPSLNISANEKIELEYKKLTVKPKYESWEYHFRSVLGIEIFFNKITKQTVAVSYKLLSVKVKKIWTEYPLNYYKSVPMLKNSYFMDYIDEDNDLKFLEKKLGVEAAKYMVGRKENMFTLSAFAPSPHFATGLWAKSSLVQLNLFVMWKKTQEKWMEIEKFIKRVATSLGDLTITTGVIGIMKLPIPKPKKEGDENLESVKSSKVLGEEGQDESVAWVSLKEEYYDFEIPNYAWKAIEFNDRGILIVMNLNPFFPTTEKICESDVGEANGWKVSNSDFSKGEIYCCNMTMEHIAKLRVGFLYLTPKQPFKLKTDSENNITLDEKL